MENYPKIETSSFSNNSLIMDKLKPSTKNKVITKKYKNLGGGNGLNISEDSGKPWLFEPVKTEASFQQKWNNVVQQGKQEAMYLDLNTSEVNNVHKDEISVLSDNMEDINNYIEENYQMVLTENMFLRQENHSIIPFLLLNSKKIHRMCLSDYEIKMMHKMFRKKLKHNRIDGIDYYKIGLIDFYKGKYFRAYNNLKIAYDMRPHEVTIAKWLAFAILVLIFCTSKQNNKIDFSGIRDMDFQMTELREVPAEDSFFFSCCISRKHNRHHNYENAVTEGNLEGYKFILCKDLEDLLKVICDDYTHTIEGWWMYMIVCVYAKLKPQQKVFKNIHDPKYCVKRIKERDIYLAYIVFAEYNFIQDNDFAIILIYKELVKKYPTRIDAYLRYWSILTKGKHKDYKQALQLSETFWRNSSIINFDNNIY
jgi:hypothetical protein